MKKIFPQSKGVDCFDPILQDPEVRGVVIASSAISHAPLAKAALMADKDVLVEKPMALNPEGCSRDAGAWLRNARGFSWLAIS